MDPYKGRGGDAHDEELLRELMAISNKNNRGRFDDEADGSATEEERPISAVTSSSFVTANEFASPKQDEHDSDDAFLPNVSVDTSDAAFDAGDDGALLASAAGDEIASAEGDGLKSALPKTFTGDRGGSAEDAELLAMLRAVSNKSATDRFNDDEDGAVVQQNTEDSRENSEETKDASPAKKASAKSQSVKPWLLKKKRPQQSADVEVVVAAPPPNAVDPVENNTLVAEDAPPKSDESQFETLDTTCSDDVGKFNSNSNLPKTFKGDRGGSAEDAELLAMLRAVSNKSATDRFNDEEDGVVVQQNTEDSRENSEETKDASPSKKASAKSQSVKPWLLKKKRPQQSADIDVVVATPPPKAVDPVENNTLVAEDAPLKSDESQFETLDNATSDDVGKFNSNSNLPKTFKGDRGGSAEDAELLAMLRTVSNKSSTDRFNHEGTMHGNEVGVSSTDFIVEKEDETAQDMQVSDCGANYSVEKRRDLPPAGQAPSKLAASVAPKPWQRKDKKLAQADNVDVLTASPATKVIDPFANALVECSAAKSVPPANSVEPATAQSASQEAVDMPLAYATPPGSAQSEANEINITLGNISDSLKSSNWQFRKEAYIFLTERMKSMLSGGNARNQLNGNDVFSSLDSLVCKALSEKIAGAHDAALSLAIMYADSCQDACTEDCLRNIASALLKGPIISSSRKTTAALVEHLMLTLFEVSPEGSSSIQITFDLIQQYGLKSKKPKVVLFSSKLVLRAVQEFGVPVFPLHILLSHAEVLIAHSNNEVRDIGLNIVAEVCRSLGSKAAFQSLLDKMKPSQISQLDSLLSVKPMPTDPTRQVRSQKSQSSAIMNATVVPISEEEVKAQIYASRPATNLLQVLPNICFKEKIKELKWSEKTAALDALIKAGGDKPYKLTPPSSSVNYAPLIRDLSKLLGDTHFAVVSKSLEALGMLAEGVGDELYPQLRPMIPTFVGLFKDKKVIKAVAACLDSMYGNVFSFGTLLDSKDSLPSSLDEKAQKNALARSSVLEYLGRCVGAKERKKKGQLTPEYAADLCKLGCSKLQDSDASTRKAASNLLILLLKSDDDAVASIAKESAASLQTLNPRVFKSLQQAIYGSSPSATISKTKSRPTAPSKPSLKKSDSVRPKTTSAANVKKTSTITDDTTNADDSTKLVSTEEAIDNLSSLGIPQWSDALEEGGILAGSAWSGKMNAILKLVGYIQSSSPEQILNAIPALFVLLQQSTSSFKESNFNVNKAILSFFAALFTDVYKKLTRVPDSYLVTPAAKLAVEKISERKLADVSIECLNSLCVVKDPRKVMSLAIKFLCEVRSPVAHETFLYWFKTFCIDFGVEVLLSDVQDIFAWILSELENNNIKVKKAAMSVMKELFSQLGPSVEKFVKSKCPSAGTMSSIEKAFAEADYNKSPVERKMRCVTLSTAEALSSEPSQKLRTALSVPSTDLVSSLESDCITRMNKSEGKNAWKERKEAMEEVSQKADRCTGLLSTDGKAYTALKEVMVALRSRMSDSQSNLKPLAATTIASILCRVDEASQAKYGKVVFPSLVTAAMTDIKKTMRDASMSALRAGTRFPEPDGGGVNVLALDALIISLQSELSDAAIKSAGLQDVLTLLVELVHSLSEQPGEHHVSSYLQMSQVIVGCLLSSKAGTRAAAEKLYEVCTKNKVVPSDSFDAAIKKFLPAQQRTVRSVIPKLTEQEKEFVDSFKNAARPRSSVPIIKSTSQKPLRASSTARPSTALARLRCEKSGLEESIRLSNNEENNPLWTDKVDIILKQKRLQVHGKAGGCWPEFPESPSSEVTHNEVRKTWSTLIPSSSAQVLLPKNGATTMENYLRGCDLIMKSIAYSRENNDSFIIQQTDLIFSWAACALSSREHTAALRKLLRVILAFVERLHELHYLMTDKEAQIVLPYLLDIAGMAKSTFHDQFLNVLSFVTKDDKVYPRRQYGSLVCAKVLDKSQKAKSRMLAAKEIERCLRGTGNLAAIGKTGLRALSKAMSNETLVENRGAYLSLFQVVLEMIDGDLAKLFSLCSDSLSENAKELIQERCSKREAAGAAKQNSVAESSSKVQTPSRPSSGFLRYSPRVDSITKSSSARLSELSPRVDGSKVRGDDQDRSKLFRSSPAIRSQLGQRIQRDSQSKISQQLPPSSSSRMQAPLFQISSPSTTDKIYQELRCIIEHGHRSAEPDLITILNNFKQAVEKDSSVLDIKQYDEYVEGIAGLFEFGFDYPGRLPINLIDTITTSLVHLARMNQIASITSETLATALDNIINSLLDDRLSESSVGIDGSALASLIQRVGEYSGGKNAAAVAELSVFKESSPDIFEAHMNNLSAPFREFITCQLKKHSEIKEDSNIERSSKEDLPFIADRKDRDSFTDLRSRIEALKNRNAGAE